MSSLPSFEVLSDKEKLARLLNCGTLHADLYREIMARLMSELDTLDGD